MSEPTPHPSSLPLGGGPQDRPPVETTDLAGRPTPSDSAGATEPPGGVASKVTLPPEPDEQPARPGADLYRAAGGRKQGPQVRDLGLVDEVEDVAPRGVVELGVAERPLPCARIALLVARLVLVVSVAQEPYASRAVRLVAGGSNKREKDSERLSASRSVRTGCSANEAIAAGVRGVSRSRR